MRRILAVHLPSVRIEFVRARMESSEARESAGAGSSPKKPLALVVTGTAHGTVKDERSLLGNTRLDEVSDEARALGIHPRDTIASARARASDLEVRVLSEDSIREVLERIADSLFAFGATTSVDVATNTVWVDVTGCTHLHGEGIQGERALVTKVLDHVRARGHAVRVALADGAFVARAIARYGGREKAIALPGKSDRALAPLPLPALDLDEENLSWLARLGFHTVGDLANLPPKSLGTRLGSLAPRILPLLRGEDPSPLVPYVPVACPEEPATFEYGVESTEALLFVAKRLCERLSERLRGRALGITNLQIVLGLDRAFAKENPTEILPFALSAPILEADDLFSLVKARFDSYELAAPALSMILRAEETVPLERSQIHLFVPEPKAKRVLPRLAAELEAELGPNRVGVLVLGNRWLPADRSVLVPFGSPDAKKPWVQTCVPRPEPRKAPRLSGAPEPVRLLHDPVPLPPTLSEAPDLQKERLFRLASVEWWNRGAEAITFEAVWLPNGSAWAFVERTSRGSFIRGWMDG